MTEPPTSGRAVRIWNRLGRRPLLAAGNSDGEIEVLDYTEHADQPTLRLLLLQDDPVSGAERANDRARSSGWTVVSIKHDWATVF